MQLKDKEISECKLLELLKSPGVKEVINKKNESGFTLLHLASLFRNLNIIKSLIELGADIYCIDNDEYFIQHLAATNNQDGAKILEYLIKEKKSM